jgi:hypothetical protein
MAGAVVDGRSLGRAMRGSGSGYRLWNQERRSMSLDSKSRTARGSSMGASHRIPGWYEVSRCRVWVAVSPSLK